MKSTLAIIQKSGIYENDKRFESFCEDCLVNNPNTYSYDILNDDTFFYDEEGIHARLKMIDILADMDTDVIMIANEKFNAGFEELYQLLNRRYNVQKVDNLFFDLY
jgi:hypothetical protein